ncbi:MAG: hypothetical protein LBT16_08845 [Treponema sp.]|jgi:hypothetical protein|nr:hypothetical protein [Treponema sp.]
MKRYVFGFCLILFLTLPLIAQNSEEASSELPGDLKTFLDIYNSGTSWAEKQAVLQEVVDAAPSGEEQFYARILGSLLNSYADIKGAQNLNNADAIARITAEKLGDAKYSNSAADLYRMVSTLKNAVVRSAGLIALGKMQAVNYLPQTIRILQDLNTQTAPPVRQSAEQLAYGAIAALEYFQDEAGYLPVFFASRGWYGDWVKNKARETLRKISEEPGDILISAINSTSYSVANKLVALQAIEESSAGNGKKGEAAAAALTQGWGAGITTVRDREDVKDLRKLSIRMLGKYGVQDASIYTLLDRSYSRSDDVDERRFVVDALSSLATDESVALLSKFMDEYNVKIGDNSRFADNAITPADDRMVRVIIPALGRTKHKDAGAPLRKVLGLQWTDGIKRLAREALQNIPS